MLSTFEFWLELAWLGAKCKCKTWLVQGYRDRYDDIDHGHEKQTNFYVFFFHRSIFTEIREFATIVLWKLVINFGL